MLKRLGRLLSEPVMGLLALLALACSLVPLLFAVSATGHRAIDATEWVIVGLFVLEYMVNLALADRKRDYLLEPWRLFDLLLIVLPIASLLPFVSDLFLGSPALRVLRLFRALLFGARAGSRLTRSRIAVAPTPQGSPRVARIVPGETAWSSADWSRLLDWAVLPTSEWIHASNLEPSRLEAIARAAGVPRPVIDAALGDAAFPRLESTPRWSVLSLALPTPDAVPRRTPFLVLATDDDVLTISRFPLELVVVSAEPGTAWGVRVTLELVRLVLTRTEDHIVRLERALRTLEEVPPDESNEAFFERTFELKNQLSVSRADLFRLRAILSSLADGRRTLPGLSPDRRPLLAAMVDDADALHESADSIRESLISLIDLHLNVASHDMNRLMRLLATASVLALIPSITGGLLGMNLSGAPWPLTIAQVSAGTLFAMLLVLYAFMARKWLR